MAIALDGTAGTIVSDTNYYIQWPHTVTSATNGILIVYYGIDNSTGSVTSLTFAGTSLTKKAVSNTNCYIEMWYLLNPPTGLGTVRGSISSLRTNKSGLSLSYTGVNQDTPVLGTTSYNGYFTEGGTVTRSITAGNLFIGGVSTDRVSTINTGNERVKANNS
jgi:hypothetical protein